jgi:hypothetical protein
MLPFGMTIPATSLQRPEILEGLMNYPVFIGLEPVLDMFLSCITWSFVVLFLTETLQEIFMSGVRQAEPRGY